MISLSQIKYLVAIADAGSMSRAAKVCHVSQPTLSMQVKKAEMDLGVIIFDRDKSPIVETLKGKEVIKQCRRVLKESLALENISFSEEIVGEFHIGVIPTIAPYLIPLFINQLQLKYPRAHFVFKERQTEDLLEEVKKEVLDFGILATPLYDEEIYETVLYYEPFQFLLHSSSGILKNKQISPEDLLGETIYQLEDGHCLGNQTEKICEKALGEITSNVFIRGGQIQTLVNLTKRYGGVTMVPELFALHCSEEEKGLLRPMKGKPFTREISLICSRYFVKEDLGTILINEILNCLPENILSLKKSKVKVVPIE